jgi:DNA polymerase-3 subunit epsilon
VSAGLAAEALMLAFPLRTCTAAIARSPRSRTAGCVRAELGTCLAPCMADSDREAYATLAAGADAAMSGDLRAVTEAVLTRLTRLAVEERFEDAVAWRERLSALASASLRTHRLAALARAELIVAAAPTADLGWDIHVVKHGRLAAAGTAPPGADPRPIVDALVAAADHVEPSQPPAPAGLTEEAQEILRWLDSEGVRLVVAPDAIALPVHCGGDVERRLSAVREASVRHRFGVDEAKEVGEYARPLGPVDARPRTRMLSA